MSRKNLRATISSALVALLLTGCHVGPKYQRPPALAQAPMATAYKEAPAPAQTPATSTPTAQSNGKASATQTSTAPTAQMQDAGSNEWKVADPQDAMLHGKWWEIYKDDELNALEEKLAIDNQTIKQYFENFMEARAIVGEARSQLYPTVTLGPSFARSQASANSGGSGGSKLPGNLTTLPFNASWEPDLWGRIHNQIREAQYNAQVSAADLEGERLTEQASLAEYFFEIRGQDALVDVYKQTVADDEKSLELMRSQYETGVGTEIAVVEAQNTLQNAQATLTNLGVARAQYEHAIAVLTGSNPSSFSIPVRSLDAVPPPIPIGVPSQLLERRPDIAASERTMASANAAIGVAYTAFFPTVTLSAEAGLASSTLSHLFDWPSRIWSLGGGFSETIYEGGLQRATAVQYAAIYNADVASYRQTVLTAFQQVEDALASERILTTQIGQQEQAAMTAQKVVELETARYETGIDPYINVVTAQATLLTDRQTLATLHTQAMTASVQLVEALGGGWDSSQLPTPEQVTKKLTAAEAAIQK